MKTINLNSKDKYTILIVITFLSLSLIGVLNHEMWRDELQAWLIAKDSLSLIDLYHNLQYEGHPGLWHLCLYGLNKLTNNPVLMQIFHVILATINILLICQYSPFSKAQKLLLSLSYFLFYEYNIISRSYGLGVLLIFLFCSLFPYKQKNYIPLALTLFLLCNTSIYGLIIALCLMLALFVDFWLNQKTSLTTRKIEILISIVLLITGVIIAILQIIPAQDSQYSLEWFFEFDLQHFLDTLKIIWNSYIPIPNIMTVNFWGTNFYNQKYSILNLLFLLYFCLLWKNKPVILILYISSNLLILIFTYAKFFGYIRHHGHLFIILITCFWLADYYVQPHKQKIYQRWQQYTSKLLTMILCFHVFAGSFAYTIDLVMPFSASKEVANFLINEKLTDLPIAGSHDYALSPIVGILNQKIFYLNTNLMGSFVIWNNQRISDSQIIMQRLEDFINNQQQSQLLIIMNYEIAFDDQNLNIKKINSLSFKNSLIQDEQYYLYLIDTF